MAAIPFSAHQRNTFLKKAKKELFDLIIIGGGITGAGIALDAAARGMKVLLVEKNDFASGTSSRSTKLIHGGLRYLKQLEINLVKEVGRERAIIYKLAPHIVRPEKMLLPIVEKGSLGKYTTSFGLKVYDWLADVLQDEKRVMLSKETTLAAEPLLRKNTVLGGGLYTEYRTDDARLVIEAMKTAVNFGATCLSYIKVEEYLYDGEKATGVSVKDILTGEGFSAKGTVIVNATGPWVDELRKKDNSLKGKYLHHTKGVHLVVPYQKLPLQQSVYFDVGDGRMIFAIPRDKTTYIGTTDTEFKEETDKPTVTSEDVEYLLNAVNYMFPSVNLKTEDITSSWSGIRPLIHEEGKSPSELSRKDEIFVSKSGVFSIAGGKLTGYRKMSERVVNKVSKRLKEEKQAKFKKCTTDKIILSGGNLPFTTTDLGNYIDRLVGQATQVELNAEQLAQLVYRYGSNTEVIVEKVYALRDEVQDPQQRLIWAEVWYGVEHEMVLTLCDFIIRRTGKLYFERDLLPQQLAVIAEALADYLGWNEQQKNEELQRFDKEFAAATDFK